VNGLSRYGGAIYISGTSQIEIENSLFSTNMAAVQGGAIYANGFTGFKISRNTRFINNLALSQGDDFFLTNTEDIFSVSEVSFDNPWAKTSIYAEYVTLLMNSVTFKNINMNNKSDYGSAL
jgi:predicted outer membrane repeat protein